RSRSPHASVSHPRSRDGFLRPSAPRTAAARAIQPAAPVDAGGAISRVRRHRARNRFSRNRNRGHRAAPDREWTAGRRRFPTPAMALVTGPQTDGAPLGLGARVVWTTPPDRLRAGVPLWLTFRVLDTAGQPAVGLEPYMGMAGHLIVVRADWRVFAH